MTIQLLTNGQGIFVERDEFFCKEGTVLLSVSGGVPDGKLYHNNAPLVRDENGFYATKLRNGHNTFSYRKGTIIYNIEPVYFNGNKATIESVIGTTEQYASAMMEIVKLSEKVKSLEIQIEKLNKQINGTHFLFG